jgi:hypothetical protein
MDVTDLSRLIDVAAWPVASIIAIIVLGPMGYLEKWLSTISKNIGQLRELTTTLSTLTAELPTQIEALNVGVGKVTALTGPQTTKLADHVEGLNVLLTTALGKIEDVKKQTETLLIEQVEKMDLETIELPQPGLEIKGAQQQGEPSDTPPEQRPSEQRLADINSAWTNLVNGLFARLGSPDWYDRRQIGAMAKYATDKRRKLPIEPELATEIASLHSQHKRFTILKSSADDWLSEEIATNFVRAVQKVSARLN